MGIDPSVGDSKKVACKAISMTGCSLEVDIMYLKQSDLGKWDSQIGLRH